MRAQLSQAAGQRAVIDDRQLLAAAVADMPVERVPAGIGLSPREPLRIAQRIGRQHPVPGPVPLHRSGSLCPEFFRLGQRAAMQ